MGRRQLRRRTLQITVVIEALWLVLVAWSVHRRLGGNGLVSNQYWDVQLINIALEWASPAIAIVVVALLIDQFWLDFEPPA